MKCLIFSILLLPSLLVFGNDSLIVVTKINSTCTLYDAPGIHVGKAIRSLKSGDPCIVTSIVSEIGSLINGEYCLIIIPTGAGYVHKDYVTLTSHQIEILKRDEDSKLRTRLSLKYFKENWGNVLDSTKRSEEKIKDSLSKYTCFIHLTQSNNVLGYPDINISIFNLDRTKSIKYVWFTINGYNPVNDIEGTKTVQAIGPIKPSTKGVYNFENVFLSKVISYCKIKQVKIQFVDGSLKVIAQKDIKYKELDDL